jgi:hypothetical protein
MPRRIKNFYPGRIVIATQPFRIGIGMGPERDGLCAKGDYFVVVEADKGHDPCPCLLCLSESQRCAAPFKSYPTVDFMRPATRKDMDRMWIRLRKAQRDYILRWGYEDRPEVRL